MRRMSHWDVSCASDGSIFDLLINLSHRSIQTKLDVFDFLSGCLNIPFWKKIKKFQINLTKKIFFGFLPRTLPRVFKPFYSHHLIEKKTGFQFNKTYFATHHHVFSLEVFREIKTLQIIEREKK
ncbi:hypothetical protein BpHYR1_001492 [Brachionus plicatilis]|uniref:Uncharacterized protein n=1 Tax=Brachionus plicatilis TaxID=10195 RepID=A0A3M7QD44_BRAPC|nr:hypothetical protein BpHYR1_001492 [Brachionus plicatilis]